MAKTKTIENLFVLLSVYTDLLPVLVFLMFLKQVKNERVFWVVISYLLFDFVANFSLLYLIPYDYHNYIYPFFTFFESLFFAYFFYLTIQRPRLKKLIVLITIIFSVCLIGYYYYIYFVSPQYLKLDSVPIGIETILIFIFSFFYFFEQMNDTTSLFIYTKPSFWIVLGIVLCLAGSFFIYIFANQITTRELVDKYWIITNIAVIIRNLFFTIALYIQTHQSIKKPPPRNYHFYPNQIL